MALRTRYQVLNSLSDAQENFQQLEPMHPASHGIPAARVYNSASISTTSGTPLALTFDSERFDNDAMHSSGQLVAKTPGVYVFSASVTFATNSTGYRSVGLRINGTDGIAFQEAMAVSTAATAHRLTVSTPYLLDKGDYAEVMALQNSGGALNVTSAEFAAFWVSDG